MLKNTRCSICGKAFLSDKVLFAASFKPEEINKAVFWARRAPDRLHYRIVRCQNCGLVRSNPILTLKKIAEFYRKSKITYKNEIPFLRKTYGYYLKRKVIPLLQQKNSLLDIGCGSGFFMQEAREQGFKSVYGVEPSKDAVRKAPKNIREYIKSDLFNADLFPSQFFDVAVCFHTLDHIVNPNKFLEDTLAVLRPGGIAFFVVHNVDSFWVKLFGESCPIFDIEHIYLFNKDTLRRIFLKNGFKVESVFNIKNYYPFYYWLKMSPLSSGFKNKALKIADFLGIAGFAIGLLAGNIGIIARKG